MVKLLIKQNTKINKRQLTTDLIKANLIKIKSIKINF